MLTHSLAQRQHGQISTAEQNIMYLFPLEASERRVVNVVKDKTIFKSKNHLRHLHANIQQALISIKLHLFGARKDILISETNQQ